MRVTAQEWQTLSPLVDEALDMAVAERRAWVESLPNISPELRVKLYQLVAQHGAPETQNFLEALPLIPELESLARAPVLARNANTESDWRIGDVIGNYTLIRAIGHGGMGDVWLAKRSDGAYQRNVALKLPNADAAPARIRERMLRERDVLASLEHANIARFYDAGVTASGQPFIAMEFVEGDTLSAYVEIKKLSLRDRCKLFLQVLSAVQFAHQRLVVHRDLKPSNIMVRNDGQVALLDFGIAKVLDETSLQGTESQLTRDTGRALTLAYAAPEQVLSEPISTATDVYAAGVLFYELISGARPFAAHEKNMAAMIRAYDAPIKAMPKPAGRDLNAIVARALRREANDRYQSAAAFSDDIKRYLDDQPVVAVQGARWYSFWKFVKRQQVAIGVAAIGLAGASALTVSALTQREISKSSISHAETIEKLFGGLLDGVDPELAKNKVFTVKEILDEATKSLDVSKLSSRQLELVLRLADLYDTAGDTQASLRLLNEYLQTTRKLGDAESEAFVLAQLVLDYVKVDDLPRARKLLVELSSRSIRDVRLKLLTTHARMELANASLEFADAVSSFDEIASVLSLSSDVSGMTVANIFQAHGYALTHINRLDPAETSYLTAARYYEKAGPHGFLLSNLMSVKLAEIYYRRGQYEHALTKVRPALHALKLQLPASHRFLLSAQYVNASTLTYSGNLRLARLAVDDYANATKDNEAHRRIAELLSVRIRSYLGDCAGVLTAQKIPRVSSELPSDSPSSKSKSTVFRRLIAECHVRTGDYAAAINELRSILEITKSSELSIAYTKSLLAIAHLKQNHLTEARDLFDNSAETIRKLSGPHDTAFIASRAYLALLNKSTSNAEREECAKGIRTYLSWQSGAQTIIDLLTGVTPIENTHSVPIIY